MCKHSNWDVRKLSLGIISPIYSRLINVKTIVSAAIPLHASNATNPTTPSVFPVTNASSKTVKPTTPKASALNVNPGTISTKKLQTLTTFFIETMTMELATPAVLAVHSAQE